jgi:predicted ABC-type transport system involved in lysophospholipase L1 biosynthesis ATPase subunit
MIELRSVHRRHGDGRTATTALANIDLTATAGRVLLVTGGAGAGKTSLLNLIGLRERPDDGGIRLFGRTLGDVAPPVLRALRAQHRVLAIAASDRIGAALDRAEDTLARLLVWDDADLAAETAHGAALVRRAVGIARANHAALVLSARNPHPLNAWVDDVAILARGRLLDFAPRPLLAPVPSNDNSAHTAHAVAQH